MTAANYRPVIAVAKASSSLMLQPPPVPVDPVAAAAVAMDRRFAIPIAQLSADMASAKIAHVFRELGKGLAGAALAAPARVFSHSEDP